MGMANELGSGVDEVLRTSKCKCGGQVGRGGVMKHFATNSSTVYCTRVAEKIIKS